MEVNLGESPMGDELPNISPGYGFRIKNAIAMKKKRKLNGYREIYEEKTLLCSLT